MNKNSNMHMAFINAEFSQAGKDLIKFVSSFDGDLSGENGEEYLWESAKIAHYDSNIEYLVELAEATNTKDLIIEVMDRVLRTYEGYSFADYNFELMPDGNYVIAFVSN